MAKSLTFRKHMTGQYNLLVMPLMAMEKMVMLRTDLRGIPFSCVHGGNRTISSQIQNRLLDTNLSKRIDSLPFNCQ
jgi:hypothetical protein